MHSAKDSAKRTGPPHGQDKSTNGRGAGSCSKLIVSSLLAGNVEAAEECINNLSQDNRSPCNKAFYHALIHECAVARNPKAAGWCVLKMVKAGIQPNKVTFNSVINACAKVGDLELATSWWGQMSKLGLVPNRITYNTMLNACARARESEQAEMWIRKMTKDGFLPCIVSFSTVIDAFSKTGMVAKAEEWFRAMREANVSPDSVIYNSLISACAKAGRPAKAEHWFKAMQLDNLKPDEKTYNSMINACAKAGLMDQAEHWFMEMERAGCKADKITFGSIIHASANVGNSERAQFWINEMLPRGIEPNLVCFNTVLHACAHNGDYEGALRWFNRTFEAGLAPNQITYNGMIEACAKAGDISMAEAWVQEMVKTGFQVDQITFGMILRSLMRSHDRCSWADASKRTYQMVIRACTRAGDVVGAKRWLSNMLTAGCTETYDFPEHPQGGSSEELQSLAGRCSKASVSTGARATPTVACSGAGGSALDRTLVDKGLFLDQDTSSTSGDLDGVGTRQMQTLSGHTTKFGVAAGMWTVPGAGCPSADKPTLNGLPGGNAVDSENAERDLFMQEGCQSLEHNPTGSSCFSQYEPPAPSAPGVCGGACMDRDQVHVEYLYL